jgi:hypothetical protein
MQVPYEIREFIDKGRGLVAKTFIPAGSLIWDFHHACIQTLTEAEAKALALNLLSDSTLANAVALCTYAYFQKQSDTLFLIDIRQDDGRFFNHSLDQNVGMGHLARKRFAGTFDDLCTYALRDIDIDEELVDNYTTFAEEPAWFQEFTAKCGVDTAYLKMNSEGTK